MNSNHNRNMNFGSSVYDIFSYFKGLYGQLSNDDIIEKERTEYKKDKRNVRDQLEEYKQFMETNNIVLPADIKYLPDELQLRYIMRTIYQTDKKYLFQMVTQSELQRYLKDQIEVINRRIESIKLLKQEFNKQLSVGTDLSKTAVSTIPEILKDIDENTLYEAINYIELYIWTISSKKHTLEEVLETKDAQEKVRKEKYPNNIDDVYAWTNMQMIQQQQNFEEMQEYYKERKNIENKIAVYESALRTAGTYITSLREYLDSTKLNVDKIFLNNIIQNFNNKIDLIINLSYEDYLKVCNKIYEKTNQEYKKDIWEQMTMTPYQNVPMYRWIMINNLKENMDEFHRTDEGLTDILGKILKELLQEVHVFGRRRQRRMSFGNEDPEEKALVAFQVAVKNPNDHNKEAAITTAGTAHDQAKQNTAEKEVANAAMEFTGIYFTIADMPNIKDKPIGNVQSIQINENLKGQNKRLKYIADCITEVSKNKSPVTINQSEQIQNMVTCFINEQCADNPVSLESILADLKKQEVDISGNVQYITEVLPTPEGNPPPDVPREKKVLLETNKPLVIIAKDKPTDKPIPTPKSSGSSWPFSKKKKEKEEKEPRARDENNPGPSRISSLKKRAGAIGSSAYAGVTGAIGAVSAGAGSIKSGAIAIKSGAIAIKSGAKESIFGTEEEQEKKRKKNIDERIKKEPIYMINEILDKISKAPKKEEAENPEVTSVTAKSPDLIKNAIDKVYNTNKIFNKLFFVFILNDLPESEGIEAP